MSSHREYFFQEAIAHARTLPVPDAVKFLGGLLQSCTDNDGVAPVRNAFIALSQSDRQLELIQSGQLKLNLQGDKQ